MEKNIEINKETNEVTISTVSTTVEKTTCDDLLLKLTERNKEIESAIASCKEKTDRTIDNMQKSIAALEAEKADNEDTINKITVGK